MSFLEFIADRPLIIAIAVFILTVAAFYVFSPKQDEIGKWRRKSL